MSGAGSDAFLIDLFREEVRNNNQVLTEGLIALEQGESNPARLEAMMRAAHSIKGAARVVNVQPAVEVAHGMEDCLVRAQKAELQLAGPVVDLLLACVDLLHKIAEACGPGFAAWIAGEQAEVTRLVAGLNAVLQGGVPELPPKRQAPEAAPLQEAEPVAQPQPESAPAAASSPAAPPPLPPSSASTAADTVSLTAQATSTEEGVVRVTATSLTRLMGLAGESLVETRWLQPFSKSLLQLKHLHIQLASTLEGFAEAIHLREDASGCADLLASARTQLAACRELLSDRVAEFDRRMRNSDDLSTRLYREVISSRMRPFRDGVQGLPRLVRDLSRQLGKSVRLEIKGENTEVDRDILERLDAPFNHLVRNAIDHGLETPEQRRAAGKPETCQVTIAAAHHAGLLSITVTDDGRGIDMDRLRTKVVQRGHTSADVARQLSDAELVEFLFLPGFSTASHVTEISGRGVGLDVVHTMVQSAGGRLQVHSELGRGTTFQITLPVTLSVLRAVIVEIAGEPYAFPHNRIERLIRVPRSELRSLENRQYFEVDGHNVGIVMAHQVLQLEGSQPTHDDLPVVLLSERSTRFGLVVDSLLGEQDLVIRPMDRRLGKIPNLHAVAILDDGSPVLIVDPDDLRCSIEKLLQGSRLQRAGAAAAQSGSHKRKRVLVVDDSITVREVERQLLANHGYLVEVAVDGMDGWNLVREGNFDLVISDIDMPRLDGLELVRKMKADSRLQAIPVVIVSYKDREEDRLRGLDAGANYYLTKSSFHDDTLIEAVRELIGDAGA
jgi:two-component system sensor histidine kinase and response regulator WspE